MLREVRSASLREIKNLIERSGQTSREIDHNRPPPEFSGPPLESFRANWLANSNDDDGQHSTQVQSVTDNKDVDLGPVSLRQ